MITQELLDYIRTQVAAGYSTEEIVQAVLIAGWPVDDVNNAFTLLHNEKVTGQLAMPDVPDRGLVVSADPQTTVSQKPSLFQRLKSLLALSIMAGILLLGAGSALAYYALFVPPSPLAILERSFSKMLVAKTVAFDVHAEGDLSVEGVAGLAEAGIKESALSEKFDVTGAGVADLAAVSPTYDVTATSSAALTFASSTGSASGSARVLSVGEKIYTNLLQFSFSLSSPEAAANTNARFTAALLNGFGTAIQNKWVETDSMAVATLAGTTTRITIKADQEALRSYFTGFSYITGVQNVAIEPVNGVNTYHLTVSIRHTDQLVTLIRTFLLDLEPERDGTQEFTDQMKAIADAVATPMTLDVWVGKNDYEIYKISVSPFVAVFGTKDTKARASFRTLDALLGPYNTPVTVTAPTDVKPLKDVIENTFGLKAGTSTVPSN